MFAWLGLAELLLTGAGEWRRAVNALIGFPAGTDKASKAIAKQWKERHTALIARLEQLARSDELREALHELRGLPPERYTDAQWEALGAIARLMPLALAELKLVFAARGEADFVEIAQGALAALGEAEAPTDLMLSLDYRIHHILVDEFQDTSFTQFELLQKLTAGWQSDDGRTLFLVGDPMQSIYRFREAEVGLFLKARHEGIGQVALEPLTLSTNFRSQADIVAWVNRAFALVMPREENIAAGAVPYCSSSPVSPAECDAVGVHAFFDSGGQRRGAGAKPQPSRGNRAVPQRKGLGLSRYRDRGAWPPPGGAGSARAHARPGARGRPRCLARSPARSMVRSHAGRPARAGAHRCSLSPRGGQRGG
jgi:ATP-dependent exoDNAse (exonuclease V) beta subunit